MSRPEYHVPDPGAQDTIVPGGLQRSQWLVTGGAGFLGQVLVEHLLTAGHSVRVLDTAECPLSLLGRRRLEYIQGDVRDVSLVERAMQGVDVVVHAAAALPIHRSKRLIHEVNVHGTRVLLDAAREQDVGAFVYVSTTAVYGLHKSHPITEDIDLVPVGPYGESKVAAEQLCAQYRAEGMHVPVLRPKTFLGRGRLGVFEILFDWIHDGKRIPLIGKGHNRYQLLDVDDLVQAILLVARVPEGNGTFNVGATEFGTLREDLEPLFAAAGQKARFLPLPKRSTILALFVLDKLRLSPLTRWHYGTMAEDSYVETNKLRAIGWEPNQSNRDTLAAAYRWYHAHRDEVKGTTGTTHTVAWNQRLLGVFKRFA